MRAILFSICLMAAGCSTVPVKVELIPAPELLTQKCPELLTIDEKTVSLPKLMETVAKNYTRYHECSLRHSAMVEWYERYRTIINGVQ